jgi:hypothetical protein
MNNKNTANKIEEAKNLVRSMNREELKKFSEWTKEPMESWRNN